MAFKVFLDANILLDFTLKREGFAVSKKIIESAINDDIQLFITPALVHILAYWFTKAYGKAKAKELIISLLQTINAIDSDHAITLNALYSKIDDIEDALQYFTAISHKMDYFITKDKQLLKQELPVLPICTPETFLAKILKD